MSTRVLIQVEDLSAIFVNCDFKNSSVVKSGMCILNILCELRVKYYASEIFIFECNISIKINHSLLETCLFELVPAWSH